MNTLGTWSPLASRSLAIPTDTERSILEKFPIVGIGTSMGSQEADVGLKKDDVLCAPKKQKSQDTAALDAIAQILAQLLAATGVDFSLYKKSNISRCIQRGMEKHNIQDIHLYPDYLQDNPAELTVLFKEMLINVTHFFRDPDAFDVLEQVVLPQLFKNKPENSVLRIWVPACASGEEAYSIAILLREFMDRTQRQLQVKIYSTDIDEDAIASARAGIYPASISMDVSPERLSRSFVMHEAGYRIKKEIREMVEFAVHDVIKDPHFTKLDLISCRNLMIYMELALQNRVLAMFHDALNADGVLFLSPSETIGNHTERFRPIERKWKFYHAVNKKRSPHTNGPVRWTSRAPASDTMMKTPKQTDYADLGRKLLIQHFAPTSIITNLKGDILYIHGESAQYLSPAAGNACPNIIEMARDGLEMELRNGIHAMATGLAFTKAKIPYQLNAESALVTLSVRKLPVLDNNEDLLLVSFQDEPFAANDLADSIINTIREPTLVLNTKLEVISTNKAFCQLFHATFMDTVGHLVYDLDRCHWDTPALRVLLEIRLPQEQMVNDYLIEQDFPRIGRRQLSINGRFITNKAGEPSLMLLTIIAV